MSQSLQIRTTRSPYGLLGPHIISILISSSHIPRWHHKFYNLGRGNPQCLHPLHETLQQGQGNWTLNTLGYNMHGLVVKWSPEHGRTVNRRRQSPLQCIPINGQLPLGCFLSRELSAQQSQSVCSQNHVTHPARHKGVCYSSEGFGSSPRWPPNFHSTCNSSRALVLREERSSATHSFTLSFDDV